MIDPRLDFVSAMQAIVLANHMLETFDWVALDRLLSDADGTLCFRDPTLFQRWLRDTQRDLKIASVKAALKFTREVGSIKAALAPEGTAGG